MNEIIKRIKDEKEELKIKYLKLADFILESEAYMHLNQRQKELLVEQQKIMFSYLDILDKRIYELEG